MNAAPFAAILFVITGYVPVWLIWLCPPRTTPDMHKSSSPTAEPWGCCFCAYQSLSSLRTAINASVGTCTVPRFRIFFLPSFCFSSSFFLRVISPP